MAEWLSALEFNPWYQKKKKSSASRDNITFTDKDMKDFTKNMNLGDLQLNVNSHCDYVKAQLLSLYSWLQGTSLGSMA